MPFDAADGLAIGPVFVRRCTRREAIAEIKAGLVMRQGLSVAFANTHLIHHALRDRAYAETLRTFLVLNDGIGLAALARLAANRGFIENLNGTDFVPALLREAPLGAKVYLVGASPAVAWSAGARWAMEYPQISIVGVTDGYLGSDARQVSAEIAAAQADIVLVAMGNPRQEMWIAQCRNLAPGPTYIGVGALFDYASGAAARAPRLVRLMRAEWLYRLLREPSRLWRRYTIEIIYVFAQIFRARLARARRAA